jgi:glycosyltransferase involved in cell wall biosynthesis
MEPRILVLAEAANPKLTSAALVAWNHFLALREVCDAHLVTEVRNRDAILEAGLPEDAFTAIDNRRPMHLAWQLSKALRGGTSLGWTIYTALCSIVYPRFEQKVWRIFGEQLKKGEFDVVHRVAPITPVAPSFLAATCSKHDVPFVLGPINGGVRWPPGFRHLMSREREWLSHFRGLHRWLPGYRSTRHHAAAIITASTTAFEDLPERYHDKCLMMPENAVDPERFCNHEPEVTAARREGSPDQGPLRIAYWGRLVPLKGLGMLFDAAEPFLNNREAVIDLAGEGPEENRLRQWVQERGLEKQVIFHGQLDQVTLANRMAQADVFGFPSVREFGGGAVLEAMALGLMPMVLDHGGPADLVTEDVGVKIPLGTRTEIVQRFRCAMQRCVNDLGETRRRGRDAQHHAGQYHTWEARAETDLDIYRWVLGKGEKPNLKLPMTVERKTDRPRPVEAVFAGVGAGR